VEFHSENKLEKLVHLVGFIIRIHQELFTQNVHKHYQTCNVIYIFASCCDFIMLLSQYTTKSLCFVSSKLLLFCCFHFHMYDDVWCRYAVIMLLCVTSYHNTVRKVFAIFICVLCCLYVVKIFKRPYCKWLAEVLSCLQFF